MNEIMVEYIREGLAGLARLMGGKHLRPAQLASTIVAVVAAPDAAEDIVIGFGKQLTMEVSNGEESATDVSEGA